WEGPALRAPGMRLAAFQVPANAPTAEVHPEVLNLQESFARVAELVKPAVVSISTVHIEKLPNNGPEFFFGDPMEQFFDQFFGGNGGDSAPNPYGRMAPNRAPRQYKMEGVGSGVIIDPDGLVLTNEHVVRDADQIKVLMYDKDGQKTEYTGRVVGKDARTDIAVVRIHAGRKLPFAALGDSDKVRVGDWAIAIGSPFGLSQTLTVGVISAARQSLVIEDKEYRNLIQTDAAINRGNSGGPLLNIRGEIVGINTAIYAPTGVFAGIGFAVPINQAKSILSDLVERGHVVRGWLGVELGREITPAMVKAFGLPDTKGALVNNVLKNSPAEKSGLQRGDVIRSFEGRAVESSDKLQNMVAQTPPKKPIRLEIIRQRKKMNLTLVLGERPESADTGERETAEPANPGQKGGEKQWQGARVVNLTAELADNYHQPADAQGVIVTDVASGSQGEEIGLMPGDIIRGVNQTPTPDVSAFASVTGRVKLSEGVVLDILRQGQPLYLSYTKGE
ncbi:MAG TPA: Do family serine endopeptidase, partial [Elusimicrobiota bacterium]|nr:Do family serine endopeptidase [Elusimicrobiota bacterium]